MNIKPSPSDDARRSLHLFAYDITDNKRRRQALKCLQHWRLNGQYSVHEANLLPHQARDLTIELLDILHPRRDRFLTCRLSQRGHGAIQILARPRHRNLLTQHHSRTAPRQPADGCYLLAYDIPDTPRLLQIQRRVIRDTVNLQRSVYLFQGDGPQLQRLLDDLQDELQPDDDLRLYRLGKPTDLWFLAGAPPPLGNLASQSRRHWQHRRAAPAGAHP